MERSKNLLLTFDVFQFIIITWRRRQNASFASDKKSDWRACCHEAIWSLQQDIVSEWVKPW